MSISSISRTLSQLNPVERSLGTSQSSPECCQPPQIQPKQPEKNWVSKPTNFRFSHISSSNFQPKGPHTPQPKPYQHRKGPIPLISWSKNLAFLLFSHKSNHSEHSLNMYIKKKSPSSTSASTLLTAACRSPPSSHRSSSSPSSCSASDLAPDHSQASQTRDERHSSASNPNQSTPS